ncbi:MAG TPA: trehalase-like domain-containing protein, partial [Humibacillus xanthopallidus]|nr:trehalase-like domain-containing protein [Humibacillus xanthopallidus]
MKLPAGLPLNVLREYAVLADGERAALVGPRGEVAWLCAPRWHDDPVFAALIGGHGTYAVTPLDERYVWGGYYEPGTLVWRGRWTADDRVAECRQALAFPGDPDRVVFLHHLEALKGDAHFAAVLSVGAGFGSAAMTDVHRSGGVWTARAGAHHVRWSGAEGALWARSDNRLELVIDLPAGDCLDLVLEVARDPLRGEVPEPEGAWSATVSSWQAAVPDFGSTLAPADTKQTYAVLRGLTSATGAMVAAA